MKKKRLKTRHSRMSSKCQLLKKFALRNARWTQTFHDGFLILFSLKPPVFLSKLSARSRAKASDRATTENP